MIVLTSAGAKSGRKRNPLRRKIKEFRIVGTLLCVISLGYVFVLYLVAQICTLTKTNQASAKRARVLHVSYMSIKFANNPRQTK